MTLRPIVSVITITLNDQDGLASTAESLLEQDQVHDIEWIVVDGGSTDGTLVLAKHYVQDSRAPRRARVLEGPDEGIVDAMNRGAAAATGHYLQFLNSGDRYHSPNALSRVLAEVGAMQSRRRPTWLYGQARVVDAEGRPVRPLHARNYSRLGHAYHFVRINHQAVFLRRTLLQKLGGFRETAGTALDFDLLLRVGRIHSPHVLDTVLVDYQEGGISQTAFTTRIRRVGSIRREVLGLTGTARAADRLFTYAFISYSMARRLSKRLAVAILGERFLGWWGNRQLGLFRRRRRLTPSNEVSE